MPSSPDHKAPLGWPVWVCPDCGLVSESRPDGHSKPDVRERCDGELTLVEVVPALVAERLAEAARRYVRASYEGIQTPEDRLEVEQALEAYEGNPGAS